MSVRDLFAEPPVEFRQAPFWFWNERLEPALLDWQIRQMRNKGLGGFVMHARHGLKTPYLSEAWMECIRHCCQTAKEQGMVAWAYDERDWPSGPAGGAVIADRQNRMSYLRLDTEAGAGAGALGEDVVAAWVDRGDGQLERVEGGPVSVEGNATRVLKAVRFECPAMLWFDSYLDTLNPDACKAFLRSTYDFHEQQLGDLKTLGLAGFFTDEPALSTYPDDLGRIPWTERFPEKFRALKGYDLLERLPALFGLQEDGAQVRFDYWDVATTLFEQAYVTALADWCEARGLKLIGHPLGEEPLFFQFRCLGTIFKYLKHQHIPGMDHLGITVGKQHPTAMTPKLVSSAALLAGRERTMTETFGESGWGLSLREMKWMADWQMVNGINYFIPHAFYYSICGQRKKDSPPSEFYQAPHWPYYRTFADYTARVTAVMTGGEHVAKIALFFPMSSIWADFVPGTDIAEAVQGMAAAFAPLGEQLLALHRDFVILDEDALAQAVVNTEGFRIGNLLFGALVLPPMTALREDAWKTVQAIGAKTVVVAADCDAVRLLNAAGPARTRLSDLPKATHVTQGDTAALAAALAGVTPDVRIDDAPDVYYLHRRKEDKDFYFFANTGDAAVDAEVSLETLGEVCVWNAETGAVDIAPEQSVLDGRLVLPLRLARYGSRLISVDPAKPCATQEARPFAPEQRIELCEGLWHFTPYNGNFLTLKQWRMSAETRHKVTELRYATEFALTERIANLRLILDGVPEHPVGVAEAARPLVASETYAEILVDSMPVQDELPWEIDTRFRVVDLDGFSDPGTHRLEIVIRNQGWFPQSGLEEYAWIAGDFMIESDEALPHLSPCRGVKCGPWEKQGYPYFSGTAAYAADILLPGEVSGKRIFLDAGNPGNLIEVEINGQSAGVRAWPPYRLEITGLIRPGQDNLIVLKVTNTARNLLEGPDRERPSGLLDQVWIEIG
jgi:hypothetical protein